MTDGGPALEPAHRQAGHRVRLEWGPTGAAALADDADVAVVVDVLSFTTTLTVALDRGTTVLPFRWRDERAAAYAEEHDAVLAVGRLEARRDGAGSGVSLSPAAMASVSGVERLVLPSPNGSAISFGLREAGCTVVGASLRNAGAVGRWLAPRVAAGAVVAVCPAGERWPDGSLRPAVEDLWGAGAVLATLGRHADLSPEARMAVAAWRAVRDRLADALLGCASGRELVDRDFRADVQVAAAHDTSHVVPVLAGDRFVAAGEAD
ncbi:2-phosphosulfolactate phosphatase [Nocardioides litoris]|uniref:2-phosphosulfolactate phosphatase n=1 Tax=Nocardioides litoris TaxID=1926648 RepID=UPI00111CF49B|nr:2-phosphosulfolactate phosphatase [Nocardioides litoris]